MLTIEAAHAPPDRTASWDAVALYETYLDEVYAYASRRLPTREDAEDATAETFSAAFASLSKLRHTDPRCWLLGIARRKVADSLRRHSRRKEVPLKVDLPHPPTNQPEQDEIAQIRRIVLGLPDDQREALLLQHLEGLSQAEIAVVMGRSPAAVNSLLQRARARAYREGKAFFTEEVEQ